MHTWLVEHAVAKIYTVVRQVNKILLKCKINLDIYTVIKLQIGMFDKCESQQKNPQKDYLILETND